MTIKVKIKKINEGAITPSYAHPGDAGLDLYSMEDYELKPGEKKRFDFGFALEIPNGYVAITFDRGSMGNRSIHNVAGIFDSGYRGEYNCHLINLAKESYQIKKGDRITQLLILPIGQATLEEVRELSDTSRGEGRMASTGK